MSQYLPPSGSVLDNKETFLHFSQKTGSDYQLLLKKKGATSYVKSVYRREGLRLAKLLDKKHYQNDKDLNSIVRRLRFCGTSSLVEQCRDGHMAIIKSSEKCRDKYCLNCQRQKSTKIQKRLYQVLKEHFNDTKRFRFYFLTLTLRHRSGDYFQEFKGYQNKLIRSKLFKETFANYGMIQAFENVIKKDNFHIHSHNLIVCDPIKTKIKDVEKSIRDKWYKITGDSYIMRLDLLGKGKDVLEDEEAYLRVSKEILKYSTKVGHLSKLCPERENMLVHWIKCSKGKNFQNARGVLRGHGITANKSGLDVKVEEDAYRKDSRYYLTSTSSIVYNHPTFYSVDRVKRKELLKNVFVTGLSLKSFDVTDYVEEFEDVLKWDLSEWEFIAKEIKERLDALIEREKVDSDFEAYVSENYRQLDMFVSKHRDGYLSKNW